METADFLDVTKIEPRLKHPTIFEHFDSLSAGEALVIHNDHDPKPLYYQLLGERGNIFTWTYLSSGPEVWEVEIRKNTDDSITVGEIVAKDLRKAELFKKMGIDFCCGGKKSLEQACEEKGLDVAAVKQELEKVEAQTNTTPSFDFNRWPLSFLVDYIVNVHHQYVKEHSDTMLDLMKKVAIRHGKDHAHLYEVQKNIEAVVDELKLHMHKEEQILFPHIKQLESDKNTAPENFNSVKQPISVMEHDHEWVGNQMREIRKLTNDYQLPEGACNSYAFLYKELEAYENDLFQHIHLENNILFQKAIELEKA